MPLYLQVKMNKEFSNIKKIKVSAVLICELLPAFNKPISNSYSLLKFDYLRVI